MRIPCIMLTLFDFAAELSECVLLCMHMFDCLLLFLINPAFIVIYCIFYTWSNLINLYKIETNIHFTARFLPFGYYEEIANIIES